MDGVSALAQRYSAELQQHFEGLRQRSVAFNEGVQQKLQEAQQKLQTLQPEVQQKKADLQQALQDMVCCYETTWCLPHEALSGALVGC